MKSSVTKTSEVGKINTHARFRVTIKEQ